MRNHGIAMHAYSVSVSQEKILRFQDWEKYWDFGNSQHYFPIIIVLVEQFPSLGNLGTQTNPTVEFPIYQSWIKPINNPSIREANPNIVYDTGFLLEFPNTDTGSPNVVIMIPNTLIILFPNNENW